jgi:hypothetical protein
MRWIWKLIEFVSRAVEAFGLVKYLLSLPVVLGIVTAILAYMEDVPWYLVLFYSSGVVFFVASAYQIVVSRWREASIDKSIKIVDLRPIQIGNVLNSKTYSIDLRAFVKNSSRSRISCVSNLAR